MNQKALSVEDVNATFRPDQRNMRGINTSNHEFKG